MFLLLTNCVFQYGNFFALLSPAVAKLCSRQDSPLHPFCSPFPHFTLWAYMGCGSSFTLCQSKGSSHSWHLFLTVTQPTLWRQCKDFIACLGASSQVQFQLYKWSAKLKKVGAFLVLFWLCFRFSHFPRKRKIINAKGPDISTYFVQTEIHGLNVQQKLSEKQTFKSYF